MAALLDPTFGTAGVVLGPVGPQYGPPLKGIAAEAVQADGKIVVVGTYAANPSSGLSTGLGARRYNPDGSVDTSFGLNGEVDIAMPIAVVSFGSGPGNVAIKADGSIVLATVIQGTPTDQGTPQRGLVVQLTPTGQLDPAFGTDGEFILPTANDVISAVAVQADGKILAVGHRTVVTTVTTPSSFSSSSSDLLLATRLTAGGALDTSFGGTGEVTLSTSNNRVSLASAAVALTPTGQIELASSGLDQTAPSLVFFGVLARLNADGTPDTTYGPGGILASSVGLEEITDMAIQPDGKVVVVGDTSNFVINNFTTPYLVRLLADGTPDPTFVGVPVQTSSSPTIQDYFSSVIVGSGGLITVGGGGPFAEQFTASGQINTQFGTGGKVSIPHSPGYYSGGGSLALTRTGKILVGGYQGLEIDSSTQNPSFVIQSILAQIATDASTGMTTPKIIPNDYDGDGRSDIAAELTSYGAFAYRKSTGGDVIQSFGLVGSGQTIPAPGDYDGDGKADVAAYLPAFGILAYRPSRGGADVLTQFGLAGVGASIPAPGDYDGDGKTDIAAYLPSLGLFAYRPSSGGADVIEPFGTAGTGGSVPAPGDYDGDGRTDVAVYLPAFGILAYRPSTGGADVLQQFGLAGAGASIPAPGDYDGDGRTDVAVYLPTLGVYAYRPSAGGADVLQQFGLGGVGASIPAPGDYDGDGRTDRAVYLPSLALFASRPSAGGADVLQQFGATGTGVTVPAASIPDAQPAILVPLTDATTPTTTTTVTTRKRASRTT